MVDNHAGRTRLRTEAQGPRLDLWDDLPGFAVVLADDHTIRGASRGFGDRFGEWSGRRCYEVMRRRTEPCVVCPTWGVFEAGDRRHWTWTDHEGRSYEVVDRPLGEEAGRSLVLEIGLDVTDRKRLEAALGESEDRYRLALETMGEGVVVLQDARIKFANARAARLGGYTVDELLAGSIAPLIHPDDRELILGRHVERIAGRDLPEMYECRLIRKDKTVWWAQVRGARFYWDGRPATLSFITDVTALKTAQQALEASREEKEALARQTHHRLRNQVQIISSLVSLQSSLGPSRGGVGAARAVQSRLAALEFIQDVLHRSGPSTRVDLRALARALAEELGGRFAAPATGIDLEVHGHPVPVDPDRALCCGLIIHELIGNALKNAFPRGGPGLISVGISQQSDGVVRVVVADNGLGLPPGGMASPPTSLGLSFVRHLVEDRLAGRLSLASGSGTRCTITFRP